MSIAANSVISAPAIVRTIDSQSQFNQQVTAHDFLIVLFTAHWCEPCQSLLPVFTAVAAHYQDILFTVADMDVATDLAVNFRVTQVPAFMVIRDRVVVDMVNGAMKYHELDHHVQMWQALEMQAVRAHFDQPAAQPG